MAVKKKGEPYNGLSPELLDGEDAEPRPAGLDRATELTLLDAALLGDMQAFSELFEHYRPALNGLCTRRLNDPSLAEDVVQEVFLKAFESLPKSDHRKPIWPWLATIAHRMCIDLQRRRSLISYSGDIRVAMDDEGNGKTESPSALDTFLASQERTELWKSLDVLTERQRRVFVLYAVDGLSCAAIAASEGISVGAVKLLLFRARIKMRSVHPRRPLPAIVLPFTWLRSKLSEAERRINAILNSFGEGFGAASGAGAIAVSLGILVAIAVTGSDPADSSLRRDSHLSSGNLAVADLPPSVAAGNSAPNTASGARVSSPSGKPLRPESVINQTQDWVERTIEPNPEDGYINSIVVSPNYSENHTMLASGRSWWKRVFVSNDGGATWKTMPSLLLRGSHIQPAPGFPADQRLFTIGEEFELQASYDGGALFQTVGAATGRVFIPPDFGNGDPILDRRQRVWMGGKAIFEYDSVSRVIQPSPLPLPPATWFYSHITFSPSYSTDQTVFITDSDDNQVYFNYRCKLSACEEMHLPVSKAMSFKLSPTFDRDGLAYLHNGDTLLVSKDGLRTIQPTGFVAKDIRDVAVLWNSTSSASLFVLTRGNGFIPTRLHRSFDGGDTWDSFPLDVRGDPIPDPQLVTTPTGRLLIATLGFACSDDFGLTWAPRCPPEQ